jgi:hypothetical protein
VHEQRFSARQSLKKPPAATPYEGSNTADLPDTDLDAFTEFKKAWFEDPRSRPAE